MGWSILRRIIVGGCRSRMMSSMSKSRRPSPSPWLMLPSAASDAYMMYSLAEQKVMSFKKEAPAPEVKLVGSSHGWLASFNRDTLQTFLSDPITSRHIKLPNIRTLAAYASSSFHLDPDNIILTSSPEAQDCRAVMTFGPRRRMAVCFPGRSASWIPVGDQVDYRHLVYSTAQKRLFCMTWQGEAECWEWDPHSPLPSIVWKDHLSNLDRSNPPDSDSDSEEEEVDCRWFHPMYLVTDDHSGRLFMVTRHVFERVGRDGSHMKRIFLPNFQGSDDFYPYKTLGIDVHEIDYKGGKYRYMDGSLDGLAMFIGNNHAFALPVGPDSPELNPDSIYFTDPSEWWQSWRDEDGDHGLYKTYGGHDIGIFNYVNRTFSSLYYSSHVSHITKVGPGPAFWFTPTH